MTASLSLSLFVLNVSYFSIAHVLILASRDLENPGVATLISMAAGFDLPGLADFGMAAVLEFNEEPIQGAKVNEGLPVVTCCPLIKVLKSSSCVIDPTQKNDKKCKFIK